MFYSFTFFLVCAIPLFIKRFRNICIVGILERAGLIWEIPYCIIFECVKTGSMLWRLLMNNLYSS